MKPLQRIVSHLASCFVEAVWIALVLMAILMDFIRLAFARRPKPRSEV